MTVRVGVIGVGNIGQDHIRRLTHTLSGVRVVAISDVDASRAQAVAQTVPGARVHPTGQALIGAEDVDAVLVTTWGPAHEEFVVAAIERAKPVFCEKPLAPTVEACLRIMQAEQASGRHLVQVGFMRRYDAGYRAIKHTLDSGALGEALLVHCAHRNPSVPPGFSSDVFITDSAIHEIDVIQWLLGQRFAAARVLHPRRTRKATGDLQDPQVVLLETEQGVLVDVEVFVNCGYGYDIRCEVVAENGAMALGDSANVVLRQAGNSAAPVPADWRERFVRAYDTELQEWVDAIAAGVPTGGPTAWEGYMATAVAESCLESMRSGQREPITLIEQPAFYALSAEPAPVA